MDTAICLYYLRLLHSQTIPVPITSRLLRQFGSASALQALPTEDLQHLGFNGVQIDTLQSVHSTMDANRSSQLAMDWADKEGNYLVCYESEHYPQMLREIDSAPPVLFVSGQLSTLAARNLALVGSRRATLYGKRNAYWMAQELSKAGLQICSGMASGIDSKAHEGALDSGMRTLAIVGTGIDKVYPSQNQGLAQRIVESGAVVSEFPLGTPPYPSNFPRRNRIISGLSLGTLVVEATLKSGSLITARLAMEQNRDVFAVPGPIASPQSRGCHSLIKQGAKLVEEPGDILEELNMIERCASDDTDLSNSQGKASLTTEFLALKSIDHQGCLFQAVLDDTKLSIQALNTELIQLEALGLIRQEGGRYFKLD